MKPVKCVAASSPRKTLHPLDVVALGGKVAWSWRQISVVESLLASKPFPRELSADQHIALLRWQLLSRFMLAR